MNRPADWSELLLCARKALFELEQKLRADDLEGAVQELDCLMLSAHGIVEWMHARSFALEQPLVGNVEFVKLRAGQVIHIEPPDAPHQTPAQA